MLCRRFSELFKICIPNKDKYFGWQQCLWTYYLEFLSFQKLKSSDAKSSLVIWATMMMLNKEYEHKQQNMNKNTNMWKMKGRK